MKILKGMLSAVLSIFFAIIVTVTGIIIVLNSIISKDYIMDKVKQSDTYEVLEQYAYQGVEQYIDENEETKELFEKFATKENMETIVNDLADEIYNNKEFDVTEYDFESALNSNMLEIADKYDIKISEEQQKQIDDIAYSIAEKANLKEVESLNENEMANVIPSLVKTLKDVLIGIIVTASILGIIIILLNLENIFTGIKLLASGMIVSGGFFIICKKLIIGFEAYDKFNNVDEVLQKIIHTVIKDISNLLGNLGVIYIVIRNCCNNNFCFCTNIYEKICKI